MSIGSVNTTASDKFVIVLNEKSPIGKLLSANGQFAMSSYGSATAGQQANPSFNGIEEDLIQKTAKTPLDQVEPYGVGVFGKIEEISSLTKKFSVFKLVFCCAK